MLVDVLAVVIMSYQESVYLESKHKIFACTVRFTIMYTLDLVKRLERACIHFLRGGQCADPVLEKM